MAQTATVPIIDFSLPDRKEKSRQIMDAMETVGFLSVDNVPNYDEKELRKYTDWFFALPHEKKLNVARKKYNPESSQIYRGYFGTNQVGSSFKEAFEIGRDLPDGDPEIEYGWPITEPNIWPQPDKDENQKPYNDFKTFMIKHYNAMFDASVEFLRLIAMGLGLHENYFDSMNIPKTLSTLRLINYPVHNFEIPPDAYGEDGRLLSTAQHRDTGILTLLCTFDYEGLEMLCDNASWKGIVSRPGSLVVNLGDTLSKMTGGRIKATIHRVAAIGRPRQSVPFFVEPGYSASVPRGLPKDPKKIISAANYPDGFEYGPWQLEYIQRFVEYEGLGKEVKRPL